MTADVVIERRDLDELLATPADAQVPLLISYLATNNEVRLKVATELLVSTGAAVVPTLLRAALAGRKGPEHRVRLLNVVMRIGAPLAADDWTLLCASTAAFRGKVREKIVEVLTGSGHATRFRGATSAPPVPSPAGPGPDRAAAGRRSRATPVGGSS